MVWAIAVDYRAESRAMKEESSARTVRPLRLLSSITIREADRIEPVSRRALVSATIRLPIFHLRGDTMLKPHLTEFMRRMDPNSVAIIPAAREAVRSHDTNYRYRQNSDFFYLTGFEEPDAIAVIAPSSEKKFTLFVRPRDPEREIWDGYRAGVEGAVRDYSADEAFAVAEFDEKLAKIL